MTSSTEQDIGYIKGKVEALQSNINETENKLNAINTKLDEISAQLSLYRHFIVFIRSVLWIGAAIVTLKFGDIPDLWRGK